MRKYYWCRPLQASKNRFIKRKGGSTIKNTVSIIIPSYNAVERLFLTLQALDRQNMNSKCLEVIVVNDGSQDKTQEMLNDIKVSYNLKVLNLKKNSGRSSARNRGILASTGDLLIFNDCDMLPTQNFVVNHVKSHLHTRMVVIGPIWYHIFTFYYPDFNIELKRKISAVFSSGDPNVNDYCENPYLLKPGVKPLVPFQDILAHNFLQYAYYCSWADCYKKNLKKYGNRFIGFNFPWVYLFSGNMSVYKENLIKSGLFDENFRGWGGEDSEMGYRLYKTGLEFFFNNEALSLHQEHPYDDKKRNASSQRNSRYTLNKHLFLDVFALRYISYQGYDFINQAVTEFRRLKGLGSLAHTEDTLRRLMEALMYHKEGLSQEPPPPWKARDLENLQLLTKKIASVSRQDSALVSMLEEMKSDISQVAFS